MEQQGDHARNEHDKRKILNKTGGVHGEIRRKEFSESLWHENEGKNGRASVSQVWAAHTMRRVLLQAKVSQAG
jgi:hypothetical protein